MLVMDCSAGRDKKERVVCINPQITETRGTIVREEGCLSFPGIYVEVERPEIVTVRSRIPGQVAITWCPPAYRMCS